MNPLIQLKTIPTLLITLALLCFGLLPRAQAVVPPPDGGYPNFNTAEGQNALFSLTTGSANTAVGWFSLFSNTEGNFNTATGAGALLFNTADQNTAFGVAALLFNTTGSDNTAVGAAALLSNTEGINNTATGDSALTNNTIGNFNTAYGFRALFSNTEGFNNTAIGQNALFNNINQDENTAIGRDALSSSNAGLNTAVGAGALQNSSTGTNNTGLGRLVGNNVMTASNVICIGASVAGEDISNTCYIGNIFNQTSVNGIGVVVNSNNKLGTSTSSKRFKEAIQPMDKASEALFGLRPVTFHYKKEIDPSGTSQFGLVAEDVEKVNPQLVVRDNEGNPYSVRYDQVNAMLLNEFLKEHRTVQEQGATITELKSHAARQEANIARQQKQIEGLTAGLQKVSARLEASKPAQQIAANN
jgi:trimeric autotransporter adhesin